MSSDDLLELSRYFHQKESLKTLKSELVESRKRINANLSKDLKKLFMKTIEKLRRYKHENVSMHL